MKVLTKLVVGVWIIVAVYFAYFGAVTKPSEGDSLSYHLPIARMIADGSWGEKKTYIKPAMYYPATGETIAAGMIKFGLPLNWYNLFGWVLLTFMVWGLGRRVGLGREGAVIAAVAVAMWPSVVRLIPNQTVDIWLAVWFAAALWKLEKQNWNFTDRWLLGVSLGFLMGTKYSGPLYAAGLMLVYAGRWRKEKLTEILTWALPALLLGGIWYGRNWILINNPVYPAQLLGWKGLPDWKLFSSRPWKTIFQLPGGWWLTGQALISEYLIWAGWLFLPLVVRNRLIAVGVLGAVIYLILPSGAENVVSDLRYNYPVFIPLMMAGWKWMKEKGREKDLAVAAGLAIVAEMTQLDFRPKLFVPVICLILIYNFKFEILNQIKKLLKNK